MSKNQKLQQELRSLNSLQHAAVTSDAESLQIVAGPGSGKTKGFVVVYCRLLDPLLTTVLSSDLPSLLFDFREKH